jgi:hypothetical protein
MALRKYSPLEVALLQFDTRNPRLFEYGITEHSSEQDIFDVLWETMDVMELVLSIAASGFFKHEPLIVDATGSKYVVIEGNRRLAAAKVLLNQRLLHGKRVRVPAIGSAAAERLEKVPVIFQSREQSWQYIGFKHVNGPAKWGSFAKSQYIADVHREFDVSLAAIASQIGDTHRTVQRLFRGMRVIEQAESWQVFDRSDRVRNHFSFSHLYTGISYPGISAFIGLKPETAESTDPVPEDKKSELGELCLWLYGSKRESVFPVIGSQNPHLRQLESVLGNQESLAALRGGVNLQTAFEISRPSSNVFEESLLASKRNLERARGLLSTGYDGSNQLLRIANEVADLAEDLWSEMDRKTRPARPKRRRSSGSE